MMDGMLTPMNHNIIVVYDNDIMFHSWTLAQQIIYLHEMLTLLIQHGAKVNSAECA